MYMEEEICLHFAEISAITHPAWLKIGSVCDIVVVWKPNQDSIAIWKFDEHFFASGRSN